MTRRTSKDNGSALRGTTILLAMCFAGAPSISHADYPRKPLRMVVGLAPGGAVDITARRLAHRLTETLGVQIVVDNKPGANGILAHDLVARAQPDGYTIVFNSGSLVQGHALTSRVKYDPLKDFSPIVLFSRTPLTVVVHPALPVKSITEFIAYGKQPRARFSYGTAGTGNITHLAGLLLIQSTGISATHVPYKGSNPALVDLVGGQIEFSTASVTSISTLVREGRLRALAVMSDKRSLALPEIPTFKEAGIPNMEVYSWVGLMGPARMPPDRVLMLNADIRKILQEPAFAATLVRDGSEPLGSTPAEYASFMASELRRWSKIIQDNRITPE